jgi:hydrogenase maturation protease
MTTPSGVLLLCFGNPARRDDGLGPALAERFEALALPGVTVDADYQLMVEAAAVIAEHEAVVFADAAAAGEEPFFLHPVEPREDASFSTHSVSPEGVMHLARTCFGAAAAGYALGIRGYVFDDFGEGLSAEAEANLEKAAAFLESALRDGRLDALA